MVVYRRSDLQLTVNLDIVALQHSVEARSENHLPRGGIDNVAAQRRRQRVGKCEDLRPNLRVFLEGQREGGEWWRTILQCLEGIPPYPSVGREMSQEGLARIESRSALADRSEKNVDHLASSAAHPRSAHPRAMRSKRAFCKVFASESRRALHTSKFAMILGRSAARLFNLLSSHDAISSKNAATTESALPHPSNKGLTAQNSLQSF
jgi:hypothetical protein